MTLHLHATAAAASVPRQRTTTAQASPVVDQRVWLAAKQILTQRGYTRIEVVTSTEVIVR